MADTKDFESEALPHLDAMFRAAVAICRNRQQAEDLVQITYLKALGRFKSFRTGTNCKAWMMRILHNTWIDQLRHRKVTGPSVPADEQLLAEPEKPEQTVWSNAEDIIENFSDEQVISAMKELPDDQRLSLFLTDVEGLSQEEVAGITSVAVGTVKSRTSRARARLRDRLMAHAKNLGFMEREQ